MTGAVDDERQAPAVGGASLSGLTGHLDRHLTELQTGRLPECLICGQPTAIFDVVDLFKSCEGYPDGFSGTPVYYVRCATCGYVFTSFFDEFRGDEWQSVIYNNRYYERIDPDYAENRPVLNADQIATLLRGREDDVIGLDYGGGNGRTAELLRARGFTFETYDPFGTTDLSDEHKGRYNFCSAMEVAEHTSNPRGMMSDIVRLCTPGPLIVLIGTLAQDNSTADPVRLGWWYASPRNGHVGLFTRSALGILGQREGLDLISFGPSQHIFFRGYEKHVIRRKLLLKKLRRKVTRMVSSRIA